jgi:hypothetical protein
MNLIHRSIVNVKYFHLQIVYFEEIKGQELVLNIPRYIS